MMNRKLFFAWLTCIAAIALTALGTILLSACTASPSPVPRPTRAVVTQVVVVTSTPPPPPGATAPTAPLLTTTGKVTQVEFLSNNQVHVFIAPEDPAMRAEFMIADWSRVSVLYYWSGLEKPTPVANENKNDVAKQSLDHPVSIGYYATEPPTIVLFSVHKQPGDPQ